MKMTCSLVAELFCAVDDYAAMNTRGPASSTNAGRRMFSVFPAAGLAVGAGAAYIEKVAVVVALAVVIVLKGFEDVADCVDTDVDAGN